MFVIFFIKTIFIMLTYLALIVSLAILLQYMRQFFYFLKGKKVEEELSGLKRKAKAIVMTTDIAVMSFTVWVLKKTATWQVAFIESIKNAATEQPIMQMQCILS